MSTTFLESQATIDLLERARAGDETAKTALFEEHRTRLEQMVKLRMDRRMKGRLDAGDVLQEAYVTFQARFSEFLQQDKLPFHLWLRQLVGQKMTDLHRQHLGVKMRDAAQEVSLYQGTMPRASSVSLAEQLMGRFTSVSMAVMRAETMLRVQDALNAMDPIDREVLVLRHFEMMSNDEVSLVLNLKPSAASNRHIRALKRMKDLMASIPGFNDSEVAR